MSPFLINPEPSTSRAGPWRFPSPCLCPEALPRARGPEDREGQRDQLILRRDPPPQHACGSPCLTEGQCSSAISESLLLRTAV